MSSLRDPFLERSIFHLRDDFLPKIQTAVCRLSTEQLWWRPNENSNSVGNLLLHLEGNLRQWIVAGLGGAGDCRQRAAEFDRRTPVESERLLGDLSATVDEAVAVLSQLDEDDLKASYSIQVYEVSGVAAVLHVVEHFSYHTGQILYVTKMLRDVDLAFYDL